MSELLRGASLSGYLDCMAQLGTDPVPLLRAEGLDKRLIERSELPIPARASIRLLERSAAASGCGTLGLRMAEGRLLTNLGSASLLIVHQPTLRHALAALSEFRGRINSTLILTVTEHRGEAVVREDMILSHPEPAGQAHQLGLGVLVGLCRALLGESWAPLLACLSAPPPRTSDLAEFHRLFRCEVQFGAEFNGLVIAGSDLDRPGALADAGMARHARALLEATGDSTPRTAAEAVERLIHLLLPSGRATIQACAATMGLTVRTLQRRLADENAVFSDLLNAARKQLCVQYLANPRLRITDVAEMLGYGSIAAFSRWHTGAFGRPARQARRQG